MDRSTTSSTVRGSRDKTPLAYLATPYWHKEPAVRAARAIAADIIYAQLVTERIPVFGPITSCSKVRGLLPANFESWAVEYDLLILAHCNQIILPIMPGYNTSTGVRREVEYAIQNNIEILPLDVKSRLMREEYPWPPNNQIVTLWHACAGQPGTIPLVANFKSYLDWVKEGIPTVG